MEVAVLDRDLVLQAVGLRQLSRARQLGLGYVGGTNLAVIGLGQMPRHTGYTAGDFSY